jgi:3',5'-cyclic AMP phosphodiesterase CpdA
MPGWAFIFLTDLHYADPETNYSDDPKELDELPEGVYLDAPYRAGVIDDVHSILDVDFRALAGPDFSDSLSFIAVGGDITTRGRQEGFQQFATETIGRLSRLVSDSEAVCIVPGNHDVIWGLNPTQTGHFTKKFERFNSIRGGHRFTTCLMPKGQLEISKTRKPKKLNFDQLTPGPIYWSKDKKVLVLNINSSIRCGELNLRMARDFDPFFRSPAEADKKAGTEASSFNIENFPNEIRQYLIRDVAEVTPAQIDWLRNELKQVRKDIGKDWDNYLRVALIHHHVAPFLGQKTEHKGYEAMIDSSRVLEFLTSSGFDLVLTGHKHQPHVSSHRFGDNEIVIIGGPTVAGAAIDGSYRGLQFIQVTSNGGGRQFYVQEIPYDIPKGDLEKELKARAPKKPNAVLSPHSALIHAAEDVGFKYTDVVSITSIRDDGDAHRVVECNDLTIKSKQCPRKKTHVIEIPSTSGYLDLFRAGTDIDGADIVINKDIPEGRESTSATVELGFLPPLQETPDDERSHFSYHYEWFTINAFALDKLQFTRKYGRRLRLEPKIEFTHFIPVDPIEWLSVIVQFPAKTQLSARPTLRIRKVNPKNPDVRSWEPDHDERSHLEKQHSLRFYKSLNIAALRVRVPKAGLSYGIEWKLPDAPPARFQAETATLKQQLIESPDETLKILYRILNQSRRELFSNWNKDLDISLMIFIQEEEVGLLKDAGAGLTKQANKPMQRLAREDKEKERIVLKFGDGIAGRAFKVNQIRIYQDPGITSPQSASDDRSRREPDYYRPIDGYIHHKSLVAFPVHYPVDKQEFAEKSSVYEKTGEPYGVVSIGSSLPECPMDRLAIESAVPRLLGFQHDINKWLAEK